MRYFFASDAHYLHQRCALSMAKKCPFAECGVDRVVFRVFFPCFLCVLWDRYKGSHSNSENGCLYYFVKVGLSVIAESGRATKMNAPCNGVCKVRWLTTFQMRSRWGFSF